MKILQKQLRSSLCAVNACVLFTAACGEPTPKIDGNPLQTANHDAQAETAIAVADLSRPPVDAQEILVFTPVVARSLLKGSEVRTLHFSASGESDYVEVKLCNAANSCGDSVITVVNKLVLHPLTAGKHIAQVRACVIDTRATKPGNVCGPWASAEFLAPSNIDAQVAALITERASKKAQLEQFTKNVAAVLQTFQQEAQACQAKENDAARMAALRGITQNYLSLGETYINLSIHGDTEPADASLAADLPVANLQKPLAANTEKLSTFERYEAAIRKFAQSQGYFDEAEPVPAVQTLSLAMFDLFTAKTSTPGECLAKQKADASMDSLALNIAALKSRINEIDVALAERSVP